MRAIVQRVSRASVTVAGQVVGRIDAGLLVYAAAVADDGPDDISYIADKVSQLRIFHDEAGKMNRGVLETGGAVLLVSAFTLLADARKGRRPAFLGAAPGPVAEPLIARLAEAIRAHGVRVETGRFAGEMQVESVNDGPICIPLDSRRLW
ncbi:D-tyrosyl-tRNA(Tyr) deacylase [Phycisphaerae bacterium RAS1]|nr:D-tyrosyl-tRNA(Tyr) deacylase [Phycisphaerae bacterium RAS1]